MAKTRGRPQGKRHTTETIEKQKASRLKAGKRKCRRCKEKFDKQSGTAENICSVCKTKCYRCDTFLTEKNHVSYIKQKNVYTCIDCINEVARLSENKPENKIKSREYRLLKKYAITQTEYDRILEKQEGKCWICRKLPLNVVLSVDHKHEKGEKKRNPREIRTRVRGLLCWSCNNAIAKLRDDSEAAARASEYLKHWPAQEVLNEQR